MDRGRDVHRRCLSKEASSRTGGVFPLSSSACPLACEKEKDGERDRKYTYICIYGACIRWRMSGRRITCVSPRARNSRALSTKCADKYLIKSPSCRARARIKDRRGKQPALYDRKRGTRDTVRYFATMRKIYF